MNCPHCKTDKYLVDEEDEYCTYKNCLVCGNIVSAEKKSASFFKKIKGIFKGINFKTDFKIKR